MTHYVDAEKSIKDIEHEIDLLYTDTYGCPFILTGVFMHEGEADYGHYWHYGYDPQFKRWIKYNDSLLTIVDESEVFADTTGKSHNAIVLIYTEADKVDSLIQPFVRDHKNRKWVKENNAIH